LRYASHQAITAGAEHLFNEQLTPVASPWLLNSQPIRQVTDLTHCTLIEAGDAYRTSHLQYLTWQRWLHTFQPPGAAMAPKRWLYFNYAYQILQAALSGQGVALARTPLVADSLASGDLVEPLPQARLESPMAYWLVRAPCTRQRPEVVAFASWLLEQAQATRSAMAHTGSGR